MSHQQVNASHPLNRLLYVNETALVDSRIERQFAPEARDNVSQHRRIRFQRLWIIGSHDAPSAQTVEADDNVSDAQPATRPGALLKPIYTSDDEVGAQSAAIPSKFAD